MNILFLLLLSSILAFVLNLGITPLLLYFAHKFKWYDTTDHRKVHVGDMPHIGGVGIVLSFIIATAVFYLLMPIVEPTVEITRFGRFFPVLVGTLLIHITGLVDDFRPIRARYKLFAQFIAAIIVVSSGIVVTEVTIPYTDFVVYFGPFGYPITVLWLVGISNAVNLTDGLDGLAGGISAIAFLFMGLVGVTIGAWSTAAIAFAICAGTAGFLVFNKPPAKIFMGDSGALTLGFLLASVMIVEFFPQDSGITLTVSLSFAAIPLSDTLAAIFRRIRSKTPIYSPDKEHTHHKLRDFGMSDNKILFIIYSLCILHGGTALAWVIVPVVGVFIAIAAAWLITLIFFIVLDRMYRGGLRIGNMSRD